MARKCVFCGNPATTNEHLWGEKVVEKIWGKPARGAFTTVERRGRGHIFGGPYSMEDQRSYTSDKPRETVKVCGICNHGWMSDLESECGDIVARMARGETVLLDGKAQFALARYAMKTGITHDVAYRSRNRGRPVVPKEDIRLLADDQQLSPRTSVHLFAYDGPRVTSYRGIPTTVRLGSPTAPETPAFRVTLLLSHLVFQVLGYTGPQQRPLQYTRKSDNFRVQIFPPTSIGAVAWPPSYTLSDAALEALALKGNFFLRY